MRTLFSSLSGPDARLIFTVTLSPSVESMTPSVKPPSLSGTQHDLFGSYGCNENIHGIERTMIFIIIFLFFFNLSRDQEFGQTKTFTSLYLSLYLSLFLSLYLSLYLSLSITLSIYHSISLYLSLYLSLILSIALSIYLSIYHFLYLSTYPSINQYSIAADPGAGI